MLQPQQYELAKQLDINISQLVKSHFLGNYKSAFKGQGISFADMRPYIEGDPEKNIDWITTAKKGELYIREYEEERQLKLFFLVDTTKSMQFHTTEKTKIQIAHDIALSMAYASYRNGDQIGGASYTEHIEKYIPTSKKKLNLYTLHTLITSSEIFRSNLANAFSTLINYKLKNHLIIIISDDFLETQHTELIKLAQHNEILYINIFDPFEMNLSIHENIESSEKTIPHIRISENNKLQEIALDNTTKKHYIKKFKEKQKYTERTIRSLGGDYLIITTDEDPIKKLMELFYKRSMRK